MSRFSLSVGADISVCISLRAICIVLFKFVTDMRGSKGHCRTIGATSGLSCGPCSMKWIVVDLLGPQGAGLLAYVGVCFHG